MSFEGNEAGNGGAIALLTNCYLSLFSTNGISPFFMYNTAMTNGGALYVEGSNSIVELIDVLLAKNQAFGYNNGDGGGAIAVKNCAVLNSINSRFIGNICSNNSVYRGGGAILADNSIINIRGNEPRDGFLPASQFLKNTCGKDVQGGALSIYNNSEAYISGTIIASNTAVNGGGIILHDSKCEVVNSIVAHNDAVNAGDGILVLGAAILPEILLQNSDITDNNGYGLSLWNGTATFQNCVLWGNFAQIDFVPGTFVTAMYSNIEGGYIGVSNINENPMFADPANLNYMIMAASPCRNGGMDLPAITTDCIDETRPFGGRWDMGAYEFIPEPSLFLILLLISLFLKAKTGECRWIRKI